MEVGVKETQNVTFNPSIESDPEVVGAMSMAVLRIEDYYEALYRELHRPNVSEPVLYSALGFVTSPNGIDFERSGIVALSPDKRPDSWDRLAVEDPTVVVVQTEKGNKYHVFHTAVRPVSVGVETAIQLATGPSLDKIGDRKLVLTPQDVKTELGKVNMVKEPEFFMTKDGDWLMIYEFADNERSRIAMARSTGKNVEGPYKGHRLLFDVREDKWDSQHVSPGPIFATSRGDIFIFYNGRGPRSPEDQTPTWAVGCAIIDPVRESIFQRSEKPLIIPPGEIGPDNQLIAFANSLVKEEGGVTQNLYYTIADRRSAVATVDV